MWEAAGNYSPLLNERADSVKTLNNEDVEAEIHEHRVNKNSGTISVT